MGRKEKPMSEARRQGVKQTAMDFYLARRISLEMAVWAMKNAEFSREETAEWLELVKQKEAESEGR
jgi:hypothetical protein